MKKIIYLFSGVCIFLSCNNKATEATTGSGKDSGSVETSKAGKEKPVYSYPIRYTEWEIGDPENIKTVLNFYYAWDHKEANKVAGFFSDTVTLRIPTERNDIVVPNNQINARLAINRGQYDSTSNSIMSAVSLHDRESQEDWVMITTYNKWVEKNGTRDSVLYHDNWKLKNGKISFLMSFYKLPSKQFTKMNDPKK